VEGDLPAARRLCKVLEEKVPALMDKVESGFLLTGSALSSVQEHL
jgi:hypothetical protein